MHISIAIYYMPNDFVLKYIFIMSGSENSYFLFSFSFKKFFYTNSKNGTHDTNENCISQQISKIIFNTCVIKCAFACILNAEKQWVVNSCNRIISLFILFSEL